MVKLRQRKREELGKFLQFHIDLFLDVSSRASIVREHRSRLAIDDIHACGMLDCQRERTASSKIE